MLTRFGEKGGMLIRSKFSWSLRKKVPLLMMGISRIRLKEWNSSWGGLWKAFLSIPLKIHLQQSNAWWTPLRIICNLFFSLRPLIHKGGSCQMNSMIVLLWIIRSLKKSAEVKPSLSRRNPLELMAWKTTINKWAPLLSNTACKCWKGWLVKMSVIFNRDKRKE